MAKETKISIVGAGNVGAALAFRFANQGYCVELISRNPAKARTHLSDALAQRELTQPSNLTILDYPQSFHLSNLVLLCVPDRAIATTAHLLADRFCGAEVVAHCSGLLDRTALDSIKLAGCVTASAHPLNTFPNLCAALDLLHNEHASYLYCEGDSSALRLIHALFQDIGFNTQTIDAKNKVLYHTACVFACNYLTVLMDMSLQTAQAAGIDQQDFFRACQPIIKATLENLDSHPPAAALSGPIARGDLQTVNRHIDALSSEAPELAQTYRVFADYATKMLTRN